MRRVVGVSTNGSFWLPALALASPSSSHTWARATLSPRLLAFTVTAPLPPS